MKDLTSSVYTFEKLIRGNYLYVDKTEYIWKLVRPAFGIYFMSRPRRFGKSLTISTLKAVFQGKRDLFKGLAISKKKYDWKEYPVIHLDMANCDARMPQALRKYFARVLAEAASEHQVSVDIHEDELAASFESLIRAIANAKKSPVVILLDEYDKPILNALATPEAAACRDVLKGFYSTIKKCESLERFVFVTGVTKFSHVSLFSDLNNLTDITMHADYATMLGYTQEEFEEYFAERLDDAVDKLNIPHEQLIAEIKAWYDGYRFEENSPTVYNPVSLAQFFINQCKFSNYW
ncbi:MAG: AAA family ATPase, partial [Lentisphaerae bacterium]|nr:AAA family ATPase [Lentisphaerota bacterium]